MAMMIVMIIIMDKTHSTTTNDPKDMSGKNQIGHWGSLSISTNRKSEKIQLQMISVQLSADP